MSSNESGVAHAVDALGLSVLNQRLPVCDRNGPAPTHQRRVLDGLPDDPTDCGRSSESGENG